ncbi:MAG: hypothetical protein WCD89_11380 [Anaerocolumna sp.]
MKKHRINWPGTGDGALLVLEHPFCPNCDWKWGMEHFNYDVIEVWNGALPTASNLVCMDWWHKQLLDGKRIPVIGGSDFHRPEVARLIGSPCSCVYVMSNSPEDILYAIRSGNCITMFTNGPDLYSGGWRQNMGRNRPHGK